MDSTQLEQLSRRQLQDLAKREHIKANAKTFVIIQELLLKYPDGVPPLEQPAGSLSKETLVALAAVSVSDDEPDGDPMDEDAPVVIKQEPEDVMMQIDDGPRVILNRPDEQQKNSEPKSWWLQTQTSDEEAEFTNDEDEESSGSDSVEGSSLSNKHDSSGEEDAFTSDGDWFPEPYPKAVGQEASWLFKVEYAETSVEERESTDGEEELSMSDDKERSADEQEGAFTSDAEDVYGDDEGSSADDEHSHDVESESNEEVAIVEEDVDPSTGDEEDALSPAAEEEVLSISNEDEVSVDEDELSFVDEESRYDGDEDDLSTSNEEEASDAEEQSSTGDKEELPGDGEESSTSDKEYIPDIEVGIPKVKPPAFKSFVEYCLSFSGAEDGDDEAETTSDSGNETDGAETTRRAQARMCVDEEPSREDKERTRIAHRLEHAEGYEDETSSQASDELNGRERHFYLSNSERSYDSWNGQSKHGFYVGTAVRDIQKSREISKWRFRRARQLDPDFDGRDDLEDVWLRACKESDEVFGYEMTGRAHGNSYVTDNGKGGLPGLKEGEGKPERNREVDGKGVNEKTKKIQEKDEGQGSHRRFQKDYTTDDGLGPSNRNEEWHELRSEHENVVGQDGNNRHGSVNRGDEDSLHAPQGTYDESEGHPHDGDPEAYEAESADLEDSPHLAVWGAKLDEEGRPYIEIDDDEDDDEDQSEENEGEGGDEEERSQHTGPQGEGEPQAIDVDDVDVQAGELQGSIGVTTAAASDSSVQIKPEPVSAHINQQSGPPTGPRLDPTKRRVYLGEDGLPIIHGATDKEVRAILRSLTDRVDAFQKHDHTMDVMELVIDANDKTLKDMAKRLANMQRGRRAIERHFMEQMKKTPSLWDGSMSWMPPEEREGAAHADQDIRMDGSSQQPNDEEARQSPGNVERPASPVQHLKRKRRSLYSSEWVRRAAIRDGFVPDDDPSIEDQEQLRENAGMPAFMQPPVWALPEHSGSADFMNVEPRAADQSFGQTHKRSRSGGLSPEPRVPKRMKNDSGVSHMEPTFSNQDVDMQPAAEISLQNQQGDQAEEEQVASRLPAEKAAGDADPSRVEPLSGDDDAEVQLAIQLSLQDQAGNPSGGNGSTSRSVEKMRADAVPPHPEVYSSGEDADMQAAIRLSLQEQHSGEALPGIRLVKESGARPFGTEAYSDQEDADYQAAIRLSLQELQHNYSVGESSRLRRPLPIRTDASSSRLEPDLDKKALRIWREKHGKDAEPTLAEAVSIERAVMQGVSPESAVEHVGVAPTAPAEAAVGEELHKSPVAHRSERFMRWVEEEMEEKSLEDFLIYWEALFDMTEKEKTLVTAKQTATMACSSNENAAVKMGEIIAREGPNAVSGERGKSVANHLATEEDTRSVIDLHTKQGERGSQRVGEYTANDREEEGQEQGVTDRADMSIEGERASHLIQEHARPAIAEGAASQAEKLSILLAEEEKLENGGREDESGENGKKQQGQGREAEPAGREGTISLSEDDRRNVVTEETTVAEDNNERERGEKENEADLAPAAYGGSIVVETPRPAMNENIRSLPQHRADKCDALDVASKAAGTTVSVNYGEQLQQRMKRNPRKRRFTTMSEVFDEARTERAVKRAKNTAAAVNESVTSSTQIETIANHNVKEAGKPMKQTERKEGGRGDEGNENEVNGREGVEGDKELQCSSSQANPQGIVPSAHLPFVENGTKHKHPRGTKRGADELEEQNDTEGKHSKRNKALCLPHPEESRYQPSTLHKYWTRSRVKRAHP